VERHGQLGRSREFLLREAVIGTALALTLVSAQPLRAANPPALVQLLTRAGEYVRRFQQEFAAVVSDEDYRQQLGGRMHSSTVRRRTQSEMLFLWMPDEAAWLTVRNVLTVDGRPVPDSQNRLDDALRDTAAARLTRLRRLLGESARFNLGRIYRNFNYPTLVLLYLDPALQSRFAFTDAGHERVNGVETWKVEYAERERPTLIQEEGRDRVSRGAVWVSEADGTIVRTRLDMTIPLRETVVSVEVDYRRDPKLEMWVPGRMHETYLQSRATMVNENIDCVAVYSNFRRFETSGRVILPK
jgi:hypothetical protein